MSNSKIIYLKPDSSISIDRVHINENFKYLDKGVDELFQRIKIVENEGGVSDNLFTNNLELGKSVFHDLSIYSISFGNGLQIGQDFLKTPTVATEDEDVLNLGTFNLLISDKQDNLESGVNIKTINNESILGSGNFELPAPTFANLTGDLSDNLVLTTEFENVYNEISTKANNYIDISSLTDGYTLLSTDAGKLITNSGVNVRTVVIPSGLTLPNNTIFIKGRITIQPNTGVTITLPDNTTITEPTQFTCEADKMYVLHRKEFTGNEWILVELGTVLLTNGSGTTANGLSIDLGGTLTDDAIINGDNGSYSINLGVPNPTQELEFFSVASQNGVQLLTSVGGQVSSNISLWGNGASLGAGIQGNANIFGKTSTLAAYDNRSFLLSLYGGIPIGSGESFTINGVTFTEGIDFIAQNDNLLDIATLAGLDYSGLTNFVSTQYTPGDIYFVFNFSQIATISETLSSGYFGEGLYVTRVLCNDLGLSLKAGTTELLIGMSNGFSVFTDNNLSPAGIQYADNYDATLLDDSLVPKRYADTKEPAITAGTTSEYYRGDKTFQTLDKTAVGLEDVDNTSDLDKPISTATQTALDLITDVNWLGDYNNGYTYAVGDGVMFNGASFRMIAFIGAAGYTPSAYPANWLQITEYYNIVQDTTPQLGGNLDLNNSDITGTGNVDVTGNVIADIVQLRGGAGTQGEMSWSADEETVQLIMDAGTTLHIGQDTFVHVRNNTASIITKGTAVYATGTLGASGRITVAPMIADGTIPGRYFIGIAAEDIAIGADGQVCSYGKIRQINTNTYTDGDVLWISPSVAGQLTTTEPTAPNLKIATAFVIHAATNGTLMVRAEQGTDLHSDQRVQVSGLTDNDVLTWNDTNQRWQNAQPTDFNSTDIIEVGGVFKLSLDTDKLYVGGIDGLATQKTLTEVFDTTTEDMSTSIFHVVDGKVELLVPTGEIIVGDALQRGRSATVTSALDTLATQVGDIFGIGIDNKVQLVGTPTYIIRFNANGEGEAQKLISGNNKALVTNNSGIEEEADLISFLDLLTATGVTSNGVLNTTDLGGTARGVLGSWKITDIVIKNTTANTVTINLGSADLGTNIANSVLIPANGFVEVPIGTALFSETVEQSIYASSSNWNSANLIIKFSVKKVF